MEPLTERQAEIFCASVRELTEVSGYLADARKCAEDGLSLSSTPRSSTCARWRRKVRTRSPRALRAACGVRQDHGLPRAPQPHRPGCSRLRRALGRVAGAGHRILAEEEIPPGHYQVIESLHAGGARLPCASARRPVDASPMSGDSLEGEPACRAPPRKGRLAAPDPRLRAWDDEVRFPR